MVDSWRAGNRKFPKHSHYLHSKIKLMPHREWDTGLYPMSLATKIRIIVQEDKKRVFNFLPSSLLMRKVEKNPWLQYCQHICCESDLTPSLVTRNQTPGCRQISLSSASIAATGNVCGHCFETFPFSHWVFNPSMDSSYCILTPGRHCKYHLI